jgi:FlaA1/EpsC-like NDP-sugar epimerase
LLTGAGGCIGSALVKAIATANARLLILLDQSEHNLYRIEMELAAVPDCPPHVPILGDVCDTALLNEIFERYHPEIIYHAAAMKHVPLMEKNPIAAVRNNAIGTSLLAQAANRHGAEALVMISTDKSVNPRSIMGASKRVAELCLLRWNTVQTAMKALRLANVWGSTGSVVPLFQEQISRGGPVTVTHPEAHRFFLTINQTVDLVLGVAALGGIGGIFVPEVGAPVKITDVARQLMDNQAEIPQTEIPILFTGLRPGEKMTEELSFAGETPEPSGDPRIRRIVGREIPPVQFDAQIRRLEEVVRQYDFPAVLDTLCKLVPEYRASEWLLNSVNHASA